MQQEYSFYKAADNAITEEELRNAVSPYKNWMDQIAAEYGGGGFRPQPEVEG
jgi:hypothetical protein